MAKIFKVKYKQRAVIERAYKRQIQKFGLVDTYAMKDSIRISAGSRVALGRLYITVNALFYLRFHDSFAADGFSTKNGVDPLPITEGVFTDPKVQAAIGEIYQQYTLWLQDNFKSISVSLPEDNLRIYVGFEFFGGEGRWNKAIAAAPLD
jgi:hypothetical protein